MILIVYRKSKQTWLLISVARANKQYIGCIVNKIFKSVCAGVHAWTTNIAQVDVWVLSIFFLDFNPCLFSALNIIILRNLNIIW